MSVIKNHQYLSTNSKEVDRKIDGFVERCVIANYSQYADEMKTLTEQFIKHPLCTEHYEVNLFSIHFLKCNKIYSNKFKVDMPWSILNFFFEIAQDPIGSFSKLPKKTFIVNLPEIKESGEEDEKKELLELLKEDFWCPNSYDDNPLSVSFI